MKSHITSNQPKIGRFLAEASKYFGLEHHDSAANLARRANKQIANSPKYKQKFEALREKLTKTETQA